MTKQELKAKIDKLENGIKSKATPSNLIAPLKAQKAKFEKELEDMETAEKKAVKTKKVSKVAEKIKAAKKSVAKKTPAKAPAKEERKKDNIARDGDRKSLPSGKRISKSGKVYYETRANRSDKQTSKKPYLADGGYVSQKINYLLNKLEYALKNGKEDEFDKISNKIHEISDNQGLNESEYNRWDEIRSLENEKRISKFSKMADGGKLPNGKYKYEKGDEGMFQGDEVRVVKYHNGDRTYEYNIIDEDGNVKTHGVAKAEKFENQFRYFPKMAYGGEVSKKYVVFFTRLNNGKTVPRIVEMYDNETDAKEYVENQKKLGEKGFKIKQAKDMPIYSMINIVDKSKNKELKDLIHSKDKVDAFFEGKDSFYKKDYGWVKPYGYVWENWKLVSAPTETMAKGGDVYDDMNDEIEFANKKAKKIANSLESLGYKVIKFQEADYDTDAQIDLSEKVNVQVGLEGDLSIVIEKEEGKFTYIDCGKSYATLLQKLPNIDKQYMEKGGKTKRTVKLTLSDKDSYDYTYKQDGATASITFGFGKEPFQYEVKKISKSLEPLQQDILDTFTLQGIKQHDYKGGFSEAIKHLDTSILENMDEFAKGGYNYKPSANLKEDEYQKLYKRLKERKEKGENLDSREEYAFSKAEYFLKTRGLLGKEDKMADGGSLDKDIADKIDQDLKLIGIKKEKYQKELNQLKSENSQDRDTITYVEYELENLDKLQDKLMKVKNSKMADGGEIDWGADLGGGFSIGNDVYITDSKSLFQGKTGFVSGAVGRDLLVTLMDNGNERSVVVSKKGVERLDAPEYAHGGYVIFEGHDHYNDKPLYQVISKDEDNDYEGEFHDNREDAEKELNELKNKDMNYAKGGYMADGGEVKGSSILQALNGYNSGLTKSGIAENLGLSNYRFGKYASESQMNSIETELKKLIELGYVEEGGVGYKITQEGAKHLDTIPYEKREKGGYMAKGGQVPAHFGSGKNIEVFGYETKNFDICGTAVKEFEAAVDIMKDSKELEKESLAYCAKYVDNLFGIEKVVVEGGIGGELNFSHAVSDIMSASTYNFRAGMAINLYSFVPQHLMEIALRLAKAEKGGLYALGGMTAGRWYKDKSGEEFKFIGKVDSGANKGRFLFSDGQKSVYKDLEEFEGGKPKETKLFGFFAEGGMVEHGLKIGDKIVSDLFWDNTLVVDNSKTGKAVVNLETGKRIEGGKMGKGGYMADGGSIPNNYQGMSAKDVWNSWTYDQKFHFLKDHRNDKSNPLKINTFEASEVAQDFYYDDLPKNFKLALEDHIQEGQYAKGGETKYTKKWKVVGITMQGKRFEKEITLGRMSDRNDVMNALKRMPDTQIREITFIGERFKAADGGIMAKGGEVSEQEAKEKLIKLRNEQELNFSIGNHGLIFMSLKNGYKKSYDNYKKAYEHYLETKGGYMAKGGKTQEKYEIELFFKGLSGDARKIGKYVVTQKTLEILESEWYDVLSIDVLDESDAKPITYNELREKLYSVASEKGFKYGGKMASGGKVKFADKVKSVQESLLKRKKVAPQVQKDYGKTYSKAEAKESAQRIVGSRMAQLKEKMAKKKK